MSDERKVWIQVSKDQARYWWIRSQGSPKELDEAFERPESILIPADTARTFLKIWGDSSGLSAIPRMADACKAALPPVTRPLQPGDIIQGKATCTSYEVVAVARHQVCLRTPTGELILVISAAAYILPEGTHWPEADQ